MLVALTILQGLLYLVLAFVAFSIAQWLLNVGRGLIIFGSLLLSNLPGWMRWLLLLPVIILNAFVLILVFSAIYWIGDLFGESSVGTLWMWGTSFIASFIVPNILVTTASIIAPNARRWIAIVTMLAIWLWLVGALLDSDTIEFLFTDSDVPFYGSILVAAISAAWGVTNAWRLEPILSPVEVELVPEPSTSVLTIQYCRTCGDELIEGASFCPYCSESSTLH